MARSAPVRPIPRSRWVLPDKLARRLQKVVARAREAALAPPSLEALGAHGGAVEPILAEALGACVAACEGLVGQEHLVLGEPLRWDLVPRDNQLATAAVLTSGDVAELDTGEGKTLAVALAAVCLSVTGRVHVVTANDYLARRDHDWMRPLYDALGVSVGVVHSDGSDAERRAVYAGQVSYVAVKDVGADYLRDTLNSVASSLLLPALDHAILDEVDFILVDEARTPLILAEPTDPKDNLCHQFNEAVAAIVAEQEERKAHVHDEVDQIEGQTTWTVKKRRFESTVRLAKLLLADPLDGRLSERFSRAVDRGDGAIVRRVRDTILRFERTKRREELVEDLLFTVDRRTLAIQLTERGLDRLAHDFGDLFSDPDPQEEPEEQEAHRARVRAVHNLLAAHVLHRRDRDYIVQDARVVLVDASTGRPSFDRHLQHGLHRAIEAKEGLYPALDHQTAAEITFPGLFGLYRSFSGTSGTCLELAQDMKKGFHKRVVRVPPHRPVIRADLEDVLFSTEEDRLQALVSEVALARQLLQPVLVGTDSVERSEAVSAALDGAGIDHQVLNARHQEGEAKIISRAGAPGAVTVATTMAGRGTDIRTPADLDRQIAAAAARWVGREIEGGAGVRLEVFSRHEEEVLLAALEDEVLQPSVSRRRKGSVVIDVGPQVPSTAFPLSLGMRVLGFERLGAARLDRQLRGRTGRQGAGGSSRFYLCLDDETVLVHGDRAKIAQLTRKSRRAVDPLSRSHVRAHRGLLEEVRQSWVNLETLYARQRERLRELDGVDQEQRRHYDDERRALLFSPRERIGALAQEAIGRASREIVEEVTGGDERLGDVDLERLDDMTQVLFERRQLVSSEGERLLTCPEATAALARSLRGFYAVARAAHGGGAMAQVERTVLLDALTEVWRLLAAERPEMREQAELFSYAGRKPAQVYRQMAGDAYHGALRAAARTAASVLVTFPLPREVKTHRTGLTVDSEELLAAVR